MSIVRMRKVFRKRAKVKVGQKSMTLPSWTELVFGLLILIFLIGVYYTFGGPGGNHQAQGEGPKTSGTVARVNGEKIPRAVFLANVERQRNGEMGQADFTQEPYLKTSVLDGLTDAILLRQAAKQEGISVSNSDLSAKRDQMVDDAVAQNFPDKRKLRDFLRREKTSLEDYKASLRKELSANPEAMREALIKEKLQKTIEDRVAVTDQEIRDSFLEVKASHILIDPQREAAAAEKTATGQKVDGDALARQKAEKLLGEIKGGADFAKLAAANSTDPGSAGKGGDLGWFKQGMMAKEFNDAAFKLQPGQVSDLVKTQFGYHIIKVTGRRGAPPKDFDKIKETLRAQIKQQRASRAWAEYTEGLRKAATIEIDDPELKAYKLLNEQQIPEGTELLKQVVAADSTNLSATWELANLLDQAKDPKGALELLNKLAVVEESTRSPYLHLKRAQLYEAQKDTAHAREAYKSAFDWASAFTVQNMYINIQIESKVRALGDTKLAGEIKTWLDEYRKEHAQDNPFGGMLNVQ